MPQRQRSRNAESGRDENAEGGAGGGRGGGFPDPLQGFGGFGFGRSMMHDFFGGRDPFDDPFFTRPFGFDEDFFSRPNVGGGFLDQRPSHQEGGRRGPIIEEIDGHDDDGRPTQEPIVEHPDDDVRTGGSRRRSHGAMVNQGGGNNGNFQSYSFQSSSMSFGGPNGQQYVAASARTAGPNGVVHEEHYEKDTAAKREAHRVSKGIYDKGHSVTRKRNAEGREETLDTLHNLNEGEVSDFDGKWQTEAERVLPSWARNRTPALGESTGNSGRQRAALPSNSGARRA